MSPQGSRDLQSPERPQPFAVESLLAIGGQLPGDELEDRIFHFVYQGAPGAFSEEAGREVFSGVTRIRALGCTSFEDVIDSVTTGVAACGILPFDNTLAGPIVRVHELLLERRPTVVAMHTLAVKHALVGLPGVQPRDVRRAHSHPAALAQCKRFLAGLDIEPVPCFDTAGAIDLVLARGVATEAAIASRRAAVLRGAQIIADRIQDSTVNKTRFVVFRSPAHDALQRVTT